LAIWTPARAFLIWLLSFALAETRWAWSLIDSTCRMGPTGQ